MNSVTRRVSHSVRIIVTGDCGHVLFTGMDVVQEKYPFWCDVCGEYKRDGKYPWVLTTKVMP
jgi:hypothetical protein